MVIKKGNKNIFKILSEKLIIAKPPKNIMLFLSTNIDKIVLYRIFFLYISLFRDNNKDMTNYCNNYIFRAFFATKLSFFNVFLKILKNLVIFSLAILTQHLCNRPFRTFIEASI